jgi:hypothetical protein
MSGYKLVNIITQRIFNKTSSGWHVICYSNKTAVQEVLTVRQSLSSYEECFSIFAQRRKDFEKRT